MMMRWQMAALLVSLLLGGDALAQGLGPLGGVRQIANGNAHSCALDEDGVVSCWGSNEHGELGVGDARLTLRATPVPVRGLGPGVRAIAAGYFHSCAITAERGVKCWGWNLFGQLGNGASTFEPGPLPVDVAGLRDVQALSAGAHHSCALLGDGSLRCWGLNETGQLGDGSREQRSSPVPVAALGGRASAIEAGAGHTCAVLEGGETRCWGDNEFGQLGDGTRETRLLPTAVRGLPGPIAALSAAARSTCAAGSSGAVSCWGALILEGDDDEDSSNLPRPVPRLERDVVALDAGVFHHCFLSSDGVVRCLGANSLGQFGNGGIGDSFAAEQTIGLAPNIVGIAAGGDHSCATTRAGGAQCWGRNNDGQLGIDATSQRLVPTPVAGLADGIAGIGAGSFHGCALSTAGGVRCWGANNQNQLGDGSGRSRLVAGDVSGLTSGVRALAVGFDHSCAITAEQRVRCWGADFDSRLGNGGVLSNGLPVEVQGLDAPVQALAQGREHGCALLQGGRVKCWGENGFGQVGNGSEQPAATAVDVTGLSSGVTAIAAGLYHSCAVVNGGLRCWGVNSSGQLGDGTTTQRSTPVAVQGLGSGVVGVDLGIEHSCALLADGSVSCWGGSGFGRLLGDGSGSNRPVPGPVPALRSGVLQVSLGNDHSCARLQGGRLRCWGNNFGGPLGDNSEVPRPEPVDVAGLTAGVSQVDLGLGGQSCAVVDGGARCWGENTFGQLGDGSSFGVPRPQVVLSNTLRRAVAALAGDANADSDRAILDASGRYVIFQSAASNLVPGDSNGSLDVFRADRERGRIERVSLDDGGAQVSGDATLPAASGDGQLVLFAANDAAVRTVAGEAKSAAAARRKGGQTGLFLRNMLTGTTQRIGTTTLAPGSKPQLAADGGAVVFVATTSSASEGQVGQDNVYRTRLTRVGDAVQIGETVCVSCRAADAAGVLGSDSANGASGEPAISADGNLIAYETTAKNAVGSAPCPAAASQVVLRNMLTGTVRQVSPPPATPTASCGQLGSGKPSLDHSGTVIAYETDQGLQAGDRNGLSDVYVSVGSAPPRRLSQAADGSDPIGASGAVQLSGDGRHASFVSSAPNLDTRFADSNDRADVHSVALAGNDVARLSLGSSGAESDAASARPSINFDGSQVAFDSPAALAFGGLTGRTTVFARSNPLAPPKRSATWWIPSESGWGLTVFDQGNLLAPTWFTYDVDGEPTWFIVAGAFPQADGGFRGDLFRFTGVPFDRIDGPAARDIRDVGEVSLRYAGDSLLQFTYQVDQVGQTKFLRRFPFGERGFSCSLASDNDRRLAANYTDLWTGAGPDAGWGLTLFHVDDLLVAIWYTYDSDGEAVFFLITSTRQADGSFAGEIFRQRNGVPFSAIDGSEPSPGSDAIGSASFRFDRGDAAQFSYVIGSVSQSQRIERLLVGDQATVCRSEDAAPR